MTRLAALLASAALIAGPALAASVSVPATFAGVNASTDPQNIYPWNPKTLGTHLRLWTTPLNNPGTPHSNFYWPTYEPSNGTYSYTYQDPAITTMAAVYPLEFTFAGANSFPSWVNATNNLANATQLGYFTSYVTTFMAHYGPGVFKYLEPLNERNYGSSGWVGTDQNAAQAQCNVYPVITAADPNAIVLESSTTPAGDNSGAQIPLSYLYHEDQFLQATTLIGAPCWTPGYANVHGYAETLSATTQQAQTAWAPELIVGALNNFMAVQAADGFSTSNLGVNEVYFGYSTGYSGSFDTEAAAAVNADGVLLMSSMGVTRYNLYSCNNTYAPAQQSPSICATTGIGLNKTGLANRTVNGWLAGATWTTPLARVVGTNQITVAPNGAGVATGLVSGPGTNCPADAPSGTGSVPTGWSISNPHSAAGMSAYITGFGTDGTGAKYIEVLYCGIDTTAGSGTVSNQIKFSSAGISASLGQSWTLGAKLALNNDSGSSPAGSAYTQIYLEEDSAGPTFLGSTAQIYAYPVTGPLVYREFRANTTQTGVTLLRPAILMQTYYNSTTPITVNYRFRIGDPSLTSSSVNATNDQWTGVLVGADGVTRCVAWDASGSQSTYTPSGSCAGFGYDRDVTNTDHTISGSLKLSQSPVIIEASPWKGIPAL